MKVLAYTAKRTASADEAVEMIEELPQDLYETTHSGVDEYLSSERVADDLSDISDPVRISVAYSNGTMYATFKPKSNPVEPPRIGARTAFELEGVLLGSNSFLKAVTGSRVHLTLQQANLQYG